MPKGFVKSEEKKNQVFCFFLFWEGDKNYSPTLNVLFSRHILQIDEDIRCYSLHSQDVDSSWQLYQES